MRRNADPVSRLEESGSLSALIMVSTMSAAPWSSRLPGAPTSAQIGASAPSATDRVHRVRRYKGDGFGSIRSVRWRVCSWPAPFVDLIFDLLRPVRSNRGSGYSQHRAAKLHKRCCRLPYSHPSAGWTGQRPFFHRDHAERGAGEQPSRGTEHVAECGDRRRRDRTHGAAMFAGERDVRRPATSAGRGEAATVKERHQRARKIHRTGHGADLRTRHRVLQRDHADRKRWCQATKSTEQPAIPTAGASSAPAHIPRRGDQRSDDRDRQAAWRATSGPAIAAPQVEIGASGIRGGALLAGAEMIDHP